MDEVISTTGNTDVREFIIETLVVRMASGYQAAFPFANRAEKDRIYSAIQDPGSHPFVVFDTPNHRVALNARAYTYCHFLFDPISMPTREDGFAEIGFGGGDIREDEGIPDGFRFWFNAGGPPERFSVERDIFSNDPEDVPAIGGAFMFLETFDDDDLITFEDEDGERVFIRASHIAVCCVPLEIVDRARAEHDDAIEDALEAAEPDGSVH